MNLRIQCPVCKREVAVTSKRLTIWLHSKDRYQCPGSGRKVMWTQLANYPANKS